MLCAGNFVFKSIGERKAGEFLNDKGQTIKYDTCYLLKVDEQTDKGIFERQLKVNKDNQVILNQLRSKKTYDKINIQFDVVLYNGGVRIIPLQLLEVNNK